MAFGVAARFAAPASSPGAARQLRTVDRLIDRLLHHVPLGGSLGNTSQRVANLLGDFTAVQQFLHVLAYTTCAPACSPRLGSAIRCQPLGPMVGENVAS